MSSDAALTQKRHISLIVGQSVGVQIVCKHHTVFELFVKEIEERKKEKKKERKKERKKKKERRKEERKEGRKEERRKKRKKGGRANV